MDCSFPYSFACPSLQNLMLVTFSLKLTPSCVLESSGMWLWFYFIYPYLSFIELTRGLPVYVTVVICRSRGCVVGRGKNDQVEEGLMAPIEGSNRKLIDHTMLVLRAWDMSDR